MVDDMHKIIERVKKEILKEDFIAKLIVDLGVEELFSELKELKFKVDGLDINIGNLEERFEAVESDVEDIETRLSEMEGDFDSHIEYDDVHHGIEEILEEVDNYVNEAVEDYIDGRETEKLRDILVKILKSHEFTVFLREEIAEIISSVVEDAVSDYLKNNNDLLREVLLALIDKK